MRGNFISAITSSVFRLALLAVLVVLGIIFVPDDFMAQVEQKASSIANFAQTEASKRAPGLVEEFNRKAQETKKEAQGQYELLKEKYLPAIGGWIAGFFGAKK